MSIPVVLTAVPNPGETGRLQRSFRWPNEGEIPPELRPVSYLPDPISAVTPLVPVDRVIRQSPAEAVVQNLKTVFVTTPHTVVKGLRGDRDFTYSDFLLLSKIPYYAGGLFLVLSDVAPRSYRQAMRTAAAVSLYYLGNAGADHLINTLYEARYGIPLGLTYRSADGRVQKALASADFPRVDLLTRADYEKMSRKMGIPPEVADPRAACNEEIRKATVSGRAMKLLLGNLLAAVGAGYVAKHAGWDQLVGPQGLLRGAKSQFRVLTDPAIGSLPMRLRVLGASLGALFAPLLQMKLQPMKGLHPFPRNFSVLAVLGALGLAVVHSLTVIRRKEFEPSLVAAPLKTSGHPVSVFDRFVPPSAPTALDASAASSTAGGPAA